jgi:hypothetical protein
MMKKLPSISPSKIRSINTPIITHVTRAIEPSRDGSRIRAWRSPDADEQHRLYLQSKKEEAFWNLRMKSRP